ncbi:uncharacterized protein V1516DRAFT_690161 [Lipomyces oligophaga]|uniref:uncharacterized protein n=1 Tax=Lipomyces oligophaga TaxID=45792 RepID=UPI0034CEDE4B
MAVFNLEDQLTFYMAYHSDKVNVLIHILCVPLIFITTIILVCTTGPLVPLFATSGLNHYLNLGTFGAIGYALFYVFLDPIVGGIVAPFILSIPYISTNLIDKYGSTVVYTAGVLFVICWIAQFVGHGVFEKRAPALLDNLVQALVLAPFFVVYEFVFMFGFRPEFHEKLVARVKLEIEKFKAQPGLQKSS